LTTCLARPAAESSYSAAVSYLFISFILFLIHLFAFIYLFLFLTIAVRPIKNYRTDLRVGRTMAV